MPRSLIAASVLIASVFLVLRYSAVERWMNPASYGWLIDKWHLGPARVINFSALTIVIVRFGRKLGALSVFQPLALLGRASIEVFCVHVLCCLLGDSLSPDADPSLPWWQQAPLLLFTVAALFATGYWHQKRSREGERARVG